MHQISSCLALQASLYWLMVSREVRTPLASFGWGISCLHLLLSSILSFLICAQASLKNAGCVLNVKNRPKKAQKHLVCKANWKPPSYPKVYLVLFSCWYYNYISLCSYPLNFSKIPLMQRKNNFPKIKIENLSAVNAWLLWQYVYSHRISWLRRLGMNRQSHRIQLPVPAFPRLFSHMVVIRIISEEQGTRPHTEKKSCFFFPKYKLFSYPEPDWALELPKELVIKYLCWSLIPDLVNDFFPPDSRSFQVEKWWGFGYLAEHKNLNLCAQPQYTLENTKLLLIFPVPPLTPCPIPYNHIQTFLGP